MDQQLTVHWHSCWTMLCDLQVATLTNTKRKIKIDVPLIGALIMWFAGRDQHMQLHHRECCSVSRKAKSPAARTWTLALPRLSRLLLLPAVDAV
jgi:hypothetical protein